MGQPLVEALGIRPGMRVLEVGAGSGQIAAKSLDFLAWLLSAAGQRFVIALSHATPGAAGCGPLCVPPVPGLREPADSAARRDPPRPRAAASGQAWSGAQRLPPAGRGPMRAAPPPVPALRPAPRRRIPDDEPRHPPEVPHIVREG